LEYHELSFDFDLQPTLGVASSDSALLYTILSPVGSYFKTGSSGAVSLLADPSYVRAWPGGVGNRKMGSNYAPTINVQKEAAAKGLQQVLWLYGEDHQLTEVGTMNIFMFFVNDQGGWCLIQQQNEWDCLYIYIYVICRTRTGYPTAERSNPARYHPRLHPAHDPPVGQV